MFSGTPEDLVLNDVFGKTFTKEGIEFDKSHGLFKVVEGHTEEIQVEGEEVGVFWTKRALERLGFVVTAHQKNKRNIHVSIHEKTWKWRYQHKQGSEVFDSMAELSIYFKMKGGHG